jgi:hypothetical protein
VFSSSSSARDCFEESCREDKLDQKTRKTEKQEKQETQFLSSDWIEQTKTLLMKESLFE